VRKQLLIFGAFTVAALVLWGCTLFGGSIGQSPGSFSYYDEVAFASNSQIPFCLSTDFACYYQVANDFGIPLMDNSSWHLGYGDTDGDYEGNVTYTNASTILGDTSNLVYISTHGNSYVPYNGQAYLCLYACDGETSGSNIAITTDLNAAGGVIPNSWGGPNWLIIDSCLVVNQNVGWESKFGGNLHGILGFSGEVNTVGDGTSAVGQSGLETLVNDIGSYQPAIKDWEDAVGTADQTPYIGMLVPQANASAAIELSGGANFGVNGATNPLFYEAVGGGVSTVQTSGTAVDGTEYTLVPEAVNESQWLSAYGDPTGTMTYPSANEHVYKTSTAVVRHYVASGGVVALTPASGTAGAVSESQALQYAETWIANNGGMPSDAVLSYGGEISNPNPGIITQGYPYQVVIPISGVPAYAAYNNVRAWVFIWRHASDIIDGDKIEVMVDDAGSWTFYGNQIVKYYNQPWISSPSVRLYSRVWRTLGGSPGKASMISLPATFESDPSAPATTTGYCAPDMASTSTTAIPCQQYTSGSGLMWYYVSLVTGELLGSH